MIHYWLFYVCDNSENILNALEDIECCVKLKLFNAGPLSLLKKESKYVERIKKLPAFNTGILVKIQVGIPSHIHKKILAKKEVEKDYRLLLAQYNFGIKFCTIKEINEIINKGLE